MAARTIFRRCPQGRIETTAFGQVCIAGGSTCEPGDVSIETQSITTYPETATYYLGYVYLVDVDEASGQLILLVKYHGFKADIDPEYRIWEEADKWWDDHTVEAFFRRNPVVLRRVQTYIRTHPVECANACFSKVFAS